MADKEYKTIDEQITILQSRGLTINDLEQARYFLTRNNYYRVSGYSLTLRTHDVFHKNACMQNIIDIYQFDHALRHILLKYLDIIEVNMKSIYSHEFAKLHGATGYLNSAFFTNANQYRETIKKAEDMKAMRLEHEAYLKHFVIDLKQDIPIWAYVDLFTIRDISVLYSISDVAVKKAVAEKMLQRQNLSDALAKMMHSMTILRNLCAHGSRLFNRLFEQKPSLNKIELSLLITDENGVVDNSHLFGFVINMKRLLPYSDFHSMIDEISSLSKKLKFVNMRYYGFPKEWYSLL